MKKQLSYKAYLKNYFFIYLFMTLLVFACYARGAREALLKGELEIKWQQENINRYLPQGEDERCYYCPGDNFVGWIPYSIDIVVLKVRQLDRGCIVKQQCGIIAKYYYEEVVRWGLWLGIALIIISQLPYGTRKSREFLVQLPLTARRRYCYETLTNAVVLIGIPILISLVTMLMAMLKGYGYQDFLRVEVYMVVISLFCFSFLTMFKEFHRNSLAGTLWGMVVLMMFGGGIEDIIGRNSFEPHGLMPQWFAVLLSIVFLFAGMHLAEGKRMECPHAIRFLFIRILMVACFLYPNISGIVTEGEFGGMFVYEIVITILWAIAYYTLIDLKYIGERLEDLILNVQHRFISSD